MSLPDSNVVDPVFVTIVESGSVVHVESRGRKSAPKCRESVLVCDPEAGLHCAGYRDMSNLSCLPD